MENYEIQNSDKISLVFDHNIMVNLSVNFNGNQVTTMWELLVFPWYLSFLESKIILN